MFKFFIVAKCDAFIYVKTYARGRVAANIVKLSFLS